jgi:biotin transport system substrate-specific component
LAVGAAIQLPLGPVPFTLQSMVLLLLLLILTPTEALAVVTGYVVIGAIGLPVFAGFRGGFGVLLGPTGGFLMGFIVATLLVGLLRAPFGRTEHSMRVSIAFDMLCIVVAIGVYYIVGTLWFVFSTGASIEAAFVACVLPFLATDALKAAAAFVCAQPIRIALGRSSTRVLFLSSR